MAVAGIVSVVTAGTVTAVSGVVSVVTAGTTVVVRMVALMSGLSGLSPADIHSSMVIWRTVSDEGRGSVVMASVPESAMPAYIDCRTVVEEIVAVVAVPKGAIPCAAYPAQRTDEVVGCAIEAPLPVVEDIAEVGVAVSPPYAVKVAGRVDAKEIFEIHLVYLVVLLGGEVELVGHLVGEEVGLCLCIP